MVPSAFVWGHCHARKQIFQVTGILQISSGFPSGFCLMNFALCPQKPSRAAAEKPHAAATVLH